VVQLDDRLVRSVLREMNLLDARANLPALHPRIDLTQGPGHALRALVMTLVGELEAGDYLSPQIHTVEHLGRAMAGLVLAPLHTGRRANQAPIDAALDYVAHHLDQNITLDELVQASGLSRRSLQRAFARRFEMSPLEYVRRRRLERARQMLVSSQADVTVTDAALQSGFGHMGRFAREYRSHFGERPSATLSRARRETRTRRSG
ncbi:MAG TPA: AraC family transcriptional regulator, partial [Steroidobacteraceae bacterium]|nr:AraC family transcriptional regulator [Steroidobacteraceae bacterium]